MPRRLTDNKGQKSGDFTRDRAGAEGEPPTCGTRIAFLERRVSRRGSRPHLLVERPLVDRPATHLRALHTSSLRVTCLFICVWDASAMRTIAGIAIFLIGLGLLLGQVEGKSHERAAASQEIDWVRTSQGWERTASWSRVPVSGPSLHPLVVAAGQGLVSVLALVATSDCGRAELGRWWVLASAGR